MRVLKVAACVGAVLLIAALMPNGAQADGDDEMDVTETPAPTMEGGDGASGADGTDADAVDREAEGIKIDGMSASEYQALKDSGENFQFQAEVSRMMKLIINSLYTNKEIFLRELISNASDALDKVRFLAVQDKDYLGDVTDLQIKIHVDKENKVLHITDTGIGMSKKDLVKHLGTIAKSGTSDFLAAAETGSADTSNLIGQFGVGFYSAFLVADTVVVTSKHNDDKQHIWESDASTFSIMEDDREDEQLGRGTRISLYLKEEAQDFLETKTIRDLITKYSEFINFDIYLYTSKTIEVPAEEEEDDEEEVATEDDAEEATEEGDEDSEEAEVEDEAPEMVEKTVWDWEIINANKPIWTRNSKDVADEEYNKFYAAFTNNEGKEPLARMHFTAEGEVTFRSILFVPHEAPPNLYGDYGKKKNSIKMYVRRVFITDDFEDLMPKYLSFIAGVVDSDDLPLNVSRETLQQHKLLKVIKKKLVRKALEMLKKMEPENYKKFFKEFGTSIKLGLIEDYANRTRLSKLLRFQSSNDAKELTSLEEYVERMKDKQQSIYFASGSSRDEVEKLPFVERLLQKGYEVLYLVEPVDEYTIQNLPEFDGKKFQNVAKEGLEFGDESKAEKEAMEKLVADYEPLTKYLGENLHDAIEKAVVSTRLATSPCALVANQYGWSGNMERIMKAQAYAKAEDTSQSHYATQKKTLEINPRHPIVKTLLARVAAEEEQADGDDKTAYHETTVNMASVLIDTARLRSGYTLADQVAFSDRIEKMLRVGLDIDPAAEVEPEPEYAPDAEEEEDAEEDEEEDAEGEEEEDAAVEDTPVDVEIKDEL
eukprot:m.1637217 g.1637217  ORF g.1637217 m.1637217 type:complete len:825 (-) comp25600_c0_seq1:1937-4411(-)